MVVADFFRRPTCIPGNKSVSTDTNIETLSFSEIYIIFILCISFMETSETQ